MATVNFREIPTLSLLYRLKKLIPSHDEAFTAVQPSQSFNDRIGIFTGDITKLEVGAIVNAANNLLLGGGGVDGAIHRAAGEDLYKECKTLKGCATGSAKITNAYKLPCKKVIHAVGPVYDYSCEDECAEELEGCYTTSLQLAVANDCKTIAFSTLSTGIYGYPSNKAAPVAIKAVKDFLESKDGENLEMVIFCTFVQKDVDAYNHWLPKFFPSNVTETGNDWEMVESGESAENGPARQGEITTTKELKEEMAGKKGEEVGNGKEPEKQEFTKNQEMEKQVAGEIAAKLPDVPTTEPITEPAESEPATKKQKSGDEEKL